MICRLKSEKKNSKWMNGRNSDKCLKSRKKWFEIESDIQLKDTKLWTSNVDNI